MSQTVRFHAAAYIRLSREDGDKAESDSVGNQRKLIQEYLRGQDDAALYDVYVDDGYSGTNFQRPAFLRLLEDIETGNVNCVIVKDLSRFGRDYIETGKYLERYFPDRNIRFISITDHIDSLSQPYDMLLPIKNIFNEQYARDISKKVHSSIRTKQKAGEFIGAFPSYGYQKSPGDKNQLIVDEYAAGIVRRIFDMYLSGLGKNSIAAALNKEGVACPSEYKRLNGDHYRNGRQRGNASGWTYSTVNRLLQNEMYTGNMVQGRKTQRMRGKQRATGRQDWIIVKGTHQAIIEEEVWRKTQDLLKRRTRTPASRRESAVFAGYLTCGDCGRALVRKQGRYYCGTYVRSGRQFCTPHSVPHPVLERILLEDLETVIQNAGDLRQIVSRCRKMQTADQAADRERHRLDAERERIRRRKRDLYEDYREKLISREEYVSYRQDCVRKEELLALQLKSLEETQPRESAGDMWESPWIRKLVEERRVEKLDRNLVTEMLDEIKVYENGRIQITYLFSGGPEKQPQGTAAPWRHGSREGGD